MNETPLLSAANTAMLDFASGRPSPYLLFDAHLRMGPVTLCRCRLPQNSGAVLGSNELLIALHTGPSLSMEWIAPGSDVSRSKTLVRGLVHIVPPNQPFFSSWPTATGILAIAIDPAFATKALKDAFPATEGVLQTAIGITDETIERLAGLCDVELSRGQLASQPYATSLAHAMLLHIFRTYAVIQSAPQNVLGGLTPLQLRRVTTAIEDQVQQSISLPDLARVARLSVQHFGQAFKASCGVTPYHYVLQRRIQRAKTLLLSPDLTVAQIAFKVGFSSQSHLTFHFRRITGYTPARFRRTVRGLADFGTGASRPMNVLTNPSVRLDHKRQ